MVHRWTRAVLSGAILLAILVDLAEGRSPWKLSLPGGDLQLQANNYDCDLCAENWLLVLSPSRGTASTTALSMFKSIPGFELIGEHSGVLHAEARIFELLGEAANAAKESIAWGGNGYNKTALLCNVQHFMKALVLGGEYNVLSPSTRVLGVKEVNYNSLKMLSFIAAAFPCARFIFTVQHQNNDADDSPTSQLFHKVASQFPSTAMLLPRDALSLDKYNGVLRGLGVKGCAFNKMLHEHVNGANYHEPASGVLDRECDLTEVDFRLSQAQLEQNRKLWSQLSVQLGQPAFKFF
eukprot:CAMPEP_0117669072 /NCGR_PEP_ID=MMETSP0804-20121206/11913_1 /TAXON_ID=1074897 /ORGANISM="Tetraselmis astigmatica, Strain CCMP880" /LENGTH=293 /DNA_ID=CAMNT_0005477057 /DNA_START=193 /DNA_END=1074 /DNA_ORIENTATION=-